MRSDSGHVACTLEPNLVSDRVERWQSLVSLAEDSQRLGDGIRLRFPRDIDITAMTRLAADEQTCCVFFVFTIDIQPDSVTLDVTGPTDAQPVITAMFGVPA